MYAGRPTLPLQHWSLLRVAVTFRHVRLVAWSQLYILCVPQLLCCFYIYIHIRLVQRSAGGTMWRSSWSGYARPSDILPVGPLVSAEAVLDLVVASIKNALSPLWPLAQRMYGIAEYLVLFILN